MNWIKPILVAMIALADCSFADSNFVLQLSHTWRHAGLLPEEVVRDASFLVKQRYEGMPWGWVSNDIACQGLAIKTTRQCESYVIVLVPVASNIHLRVDAVFSMQIRFNVYNHYGMPVSTTALVAEANAWLSTEIDATKTRSNLVHTFSESLAINKLLRSQRLNGLIGISRVPKRMELAYDLIRDGEVWFWGYNFKLCFGKTQANGWDSERWFSIASTQDPPRDGRSNGSKLWIGPFKRREEIRDWGGFGNP